MPLQIKYGKPNCKHTLVERSDANVRPGLFGAVCVDCGAFVYIPLEELDKHSVAGEPLPSNANPNGNWENPFCSEQKEKIWI